MHFNNYCNAISNFQLSIRGTDIINLNKMILFDTQLKLGYKNTLLVDDPNLLVFFFISTLN